MINNEFYNHLGEEWLHRDDHPVAMLRRENAFRTPWVIKEIQTRVGASANILDVGCGAGLLTNPLASAGYGVTGIDLSESSLEVARKSDVSGTVQYLRAHAYSLPLDKESFDVVCAMDVLEHVEEPELLIAEASRVLKPGGLFFFHTFNRTLFSYLTVIKGMEWFVPNSPKNVHVYPLFIKPEEMKDYLFSYHMQPVMWTGLQPKIFSPSLLKMLYRRIVPTDFSFRFTRSLRAGYCGIAKKDA